MSLGVVDALLCCGSVERSSVQERCLLKRSEDVRAFPMHLACQNMRRICSLGGTQVACSCEFAAGGVPDLLPCVYWRCSGLDLAFSRPKAHFVSVDYFAVEVGRRTAAFGIMQLGFTLLLLWRTTSNV